MENTRNGSNRNLWDAYSWTKEESEELILLYLEDYYRTLKEEYLSEALQLAKDEGVDMEKMFHRARARLH